MSELPLSYQLPEDRGFASRKPDNEIPDSNRLAIYPVPQLGSDVTQSSDYCGQPERVQLS